MTDKRLNIGAMRCEKFDHLCPDARRVREAVFVEEQKFADEFDDIDNFATVLVFYDGSTPAGICRYFKDDNGWHIGRVAVMKEYRGTGLGAKIMLAAECEIVKKGGKEVFVSAQKRAEGFYSRLGYMPEGEPYFEEYCEHIRMRKRL